MATNYGDNPWQFLNHVVTYETKLCCVLWNLLEMKSDGFHIMMLFSTQVEFPIGQFILEVTFSFEWDPFSEYPWSIAIIGGS